MVRHNKVTGTRKKLLHVEEKGNSINMQTVIGEDVPNGFDQNESKGGKLWV